MSPNREHNQYRSLADRRVSAGALSISVGYILYMYKENYDGGARNQYE